MTAIANTQNLIDNIRGLLITLLILGAEGGGSMYALLYKVHSSSLKAWIGVKDWIGLSRLEVQVRMVLLRLCAATDGRQRPFPGSGDQNMTPNNDVEAFVGAYLLADCISLA
jgi:hypothetical protein